MFLLAASLKIMIDMYKITEVILEIDILNYFRFHSSQIRLKNNVSKLIIKLLADNILFFQEKVLSLVSRNKQHFSSA